MKAYHRNGKYTLEVLEFAKNYNAWIASKLLPYLTSPILEVGAGTGNITQHIASTNTSLHVSDVDRLLVANLKRKFGKQSGLSIYPLDIEKKVPVTRKKFFSSIYAVNVLEHIEDDQRALIHMREMLRARGKIVLLVPAKKFAYITLDRELGHYRRYEKNELMEKLEKTGFTVETIEFFNIVGIVSWFIRDKFTSEHTHLTSHQIAVFEGIIPILRFIESIIPIPVGVSLIAVGRVK